MISIESTGFDATIAALKKKSAALKDLTPAYKRWAADVVWAVDESFQNQRGYDGEAWAPLAQSTIEKRIAKLKSANKRGKNGRLTKHAIMLQKRLRSPGGLKILIDTARARNSQHADTSKDGVEWSAVGYLAFHMVQHILAPMRNPTPFIMKSSRWVLRDSAMKELKRRIHDHVFGEVP